MLAFYGITVFGALFISAVATLIFTFEPLADDIGFALGDLLERGMVFQTLSIFTVSSVFAGYFGIGMTGFFNANDESLLMPSPAQPHQLFVSKYVTRLVRKMAYLLIVMFIFFPLIQSAGIVVASLMVGVLYIIAFLEINFFIGGICSFVRIRVSRRTSHPIRHLALLLLLVLAYLPSDPAVSAFSVAAVWPANALGIVLTELTGIMAVGYGPLLGYVSIIVVFSITFLLVAILSDYDLYDEYAASTSRSNDESRIGRMVRGEVDFSNSRFNDPMMWIMIKDFFSRMRQPLQFWKYVYVAIGTAFVLWINITQPLWISPFPIPPQVAYSAEPAFLLLLMLMVQVAGLTSLLAFIDERENIYLLRASPFRSRDIVLAKYILSVIEVTLATLPILGFMLYFFRVQGSLFLATLVAPMILIFCASGTMVGAYVPVFTNDPKNPPVPLAFSFPAINLTLGAVTIVIAATLAESNLLLIYLPIFTTIVVMVFLTLAINALKSYR
jgi:hypothetical protein